MAMEKFIARFGKQHAVLPVVHVQQYDEALFNVELARDCGADGAWLISHGEVSQFDIPLWQKNMIDTTGWLNIGINLLGVSPEHVFARADPRGLGVWADNSGIQDNDVLEAERINSHRSILGDNQLYFGGVAFKHQAEIVDVGKAAINAEAFMDVICTSGEATGSAPTISKIASMHAHSPWHPLAIASGITPENIEDFLPYANAFLVATGVKKDFYNIDRAKLAALIAVVSSYK